MQEVEQAQVYGVRFACPMIAENVADGRRRILWNDAILPILNCKRFAGM